MRKYVILSAALLSACAPAAVRDQDAAAANAPDTPTTITARQAEPPAPDSLRFTMTLPARVHSGEPVTFTLTLQNLLDRPVRIHYLDEPIWNVIVTHPDGRPVWTRLGGPAGLFDIPRSRELQAGERWEQVFRWEQRDAEGDPVPSGSYVARGVLVLDLDRRFSTEAVPFTISQ